MTMDPVRRFVLIDLDNTLFDNLQTRHYAMKSALSCLELNLGIEEALEKYETIVDLCDTFELLGFENYKHFWNCKSLYGTLIVLYGNQQRYQNSLKLSKSEQKHFFEILTSINESIGKKKRKGDFPRKVNCVLNRIINDKGVKKFIEKVRLAATLKEVEKAYQIFESTLEFKPYDGVKKLLELFNKQEIQSFVVTEGYTRIQRQKIKKLGLISEFKDKTLTTEDMSTPIGLNTLLKEIKQLERIKTKRILKQHEKVRLNCLLTIQNVFNSYKDKSNPYFYSRVIHTIVKNPHFPQKEVKKFSFFSHKEWERQPPLKLAIIGDRYDKEILPLIQLLGKNQVLTIRLNVTKHKNSFPTNDLSKSLRPTFSVQDFKKVYEIFQNDDIWERVNNITQAPLLFPKKVLRECLQFGDNYQLIIKMVKYVKDNENMNL